ncbi:MFS transporter [Glutamicibacter sp. MNS18]|uniref:CynX/NimT family MFS transporter n=1 Tax=Glutamicibacter sp. MNS18 TaxID=2989817 RepID=UPI0022357D64|nr:MFS transporter [Glutamicibacter sp. MNS18]MCW4465466.1 MFS transporter [Glutamicibacter sp. MNS18]
MTNRRTALPRGFAPLLVVAMILAAINLRPAVTSLGALLDPVIEGLGMNGFIAGMLTGVPPLCFALLGPLAPRLAGKRGPELVVIGAIGAIMTGILLRSAAPMTWVFLLCTALALAGIAVGNILMPVLVKRWFPQKIGLVTGTYTTAVALGAASVAGAAVPLTGALGGNWRLGLGVWAIPAAVALVLWIVIYFGLRTQIAVRQQPVATLPGRAAALGPMRKNPTAWWVAIFFGTQSSAAYIFMGWAPKIFTDFGVDPGYAGALLAVILGVGVPLSFIMPALAARFTNQGPLVWVTGSAGILAVAGLLSFPAQGALLWAILLGVAGANFPLALTMIGLKAHTAAGVAKLSAFGQSVGYLIAFPGPFAVGALHEITGSWVAPICLLGALMVAQTIAGIMAGKPRYVEDGVRIRV